MLLEARAVEAVWGTWSQGKKRSVEGGSGFRESKRKNENGQGILAKGQGRMAEAVRGGGGFLTSGSGRGSLIFFGSMKAKSVDQAHECDVTD